MIPSFSRFSFSNAGYDDEDRFSEEYEPDSEDSFSSDGTEPLSPIDKV